MYVDSKGRKKGRWSTMRGKKEENINFIFQAWCKINCRNRNERVYACILTSIMHVA